jgi:hypothetical protein
MSRFNYLVKADLCCDRVQRNDFMNNNLSSHVMALNMCCVDMFPTYSDEIMYTESEYVLIVCEKSISPHMSV